MKYLKKTLSFVLAFAMMFTMVIVPKTSVSEAAASDYTYFDTTMFNYDTDTFNAATKALEKNGQQGIYFNDGGMTTNIPHENINNRDYNIWTGQPGKNGKEYAYTGLVKSDLDKSGNIQFNYPQAGIFDTTKTTGKNTYTNVKMPFKKDSDGYYYYDSYKYDVKFPNNKPANNAKLEDEGLSKLSSDGKGAFLPFSKNTSRNVDSNPTFHFGMDMSVKFYMPENGQITTSDGSKKDMTFEFSGDDDVWVFVDGKLVLDIGGIHNAIKGDINFNKGVATVYKGQTNASVTTTDIYTSNVLGTNWKNETNKVHTLQVFYLERGRGESNCKIKFNLEIKDQLQVTKSLGNKAEDDKDLKALLSNRFNFKIYSSEDKTNYTAYKNKKYYIYKNGSQTGIGTTGTDGSFTLGFNETALFVGSDFTSGKTYKVKEIVDDNPTYTSTWQTSSKIPGSETIEDKGTTGQKDAIITTAKKESDKTEAANYEFVFTNTFNASLKDDVVVLDYGKPVEIDVLSNDVLYGSTRKVKDIVENNCQNGTLELTADKSKVKYTPTRYMNSVDTAKYSVYLDKIANPTTKTANVSIMPATSVYYEDDFGADDNSNPNVAIVWSEGWNTDGKSQSETQSDKNSQYGWDDSYKDDTGYSNGSAHVSSQNFATATFRFTGTGVDVYSRTNEGVGKISTSLKKVTKNADGTETVKAIKYKSIDNLSISGDYYQIPTLNYDDLNYGTYEVTIKVITVSAENRGTYYLDGIRVYNPLGKVDANPVAGKAYKEAGESNAQYIQVRKDLLDSSKVQAIDTDIQGSLFIDKSEEGITNIGTYKDYGPKNEVYLKSYIDKSDTTKNKIQGVAFNINGYNSDNNKVFIGLKSPTGKEVTVKVTSGEKTEKIKLNSAADLYYQITPDTKGNVVIENMSDNLLSITKVRITSKVLPTNNFALTSTPELISYVNTFDALQEKQDTNQKDTADTLDKGDVDINNPGDNDTNKDNSSQDNNEQTKPDNTWNKIMNSIKSWFRR